MQYAASFQCLVEPWKDCEELKPKPKEKEVFVEKKSENSMIFEEEQGHETTFGKKLQCESGS